MGNPNKNPGNPNKNLGNPNINPGNPNKKISFFISYRFSVT
jgi:hypothetical protein